MQQRFRYELNSLVLHENIFTTVFQQWLNVIKQHHTFNSKLTQHSSKVTFARLVINYLFP